MTPALFTPLPLGPFDLVNRVVVAPMCMYSANDGCASVWHIQHLMQFAMSGAGLVVVEATAVERRGRITHGCLGLYDDATEAALANALAAARGVVLPGTRFGIQIAHAGRKAGVRRPWEDGKPLGPDEDPWTPCAPSPIPFAPDYKTPEALDAAGMTRVKSAFVQAAQRAVRLGFDVVELHGAHGYLMHSFLSPLTNQRKDGYGGSLENRMRFPLEIARAVKEVLPKHVVMSARLTATDWIDGGWSPDDAAGFAKSLAAVGVGYICASSGATAPGAKIPQTPGYQVALATHIKRLAGVNTRAVGQIITPEQANGIVERGEADLIALARAMIDNPRWVWHAAQKFGVAISYPPQYDRAAPQYWKGQPWARAGAVPS